MTRGYTTHDRERIVAIATAFLSGRVEKGEVDEKDDEAMGRAMRECVRDAAAVYNAALEYVAG
jgi:ferredoxin